MNNQAYKIKMPRKDLNLTGAAELVGEDQNSAQFADYPRTSAKIQPSPSKKPVNACNGSNLAVGFYHGYGSN